jgi:hypothetical protein
MPNLVGGCLCGSLRYSASGEPTATSICHCTDCQKQTGSAFLEVVVVPKTAFSISGQSQQYSNAGESGRKLARVFCPRCASTVMLDVELYPDSALIMAGTLDDASWFRPTVSLFCDSAQPWITMPEDVQKFDRMPPT